MFIEVNTVQLYYEVTGEGRPLLLLHGNGESHEIFGALVPKLSEHFRVYAIDSRMHGKSSKNCAITYELMAQDIYDFIAALSLERPLIYGFSDGGIVALLLASAHPDSVSAIMISGANMLPTGLKASCITMIRAGYMLNRSPLAKLMLNGPYISAEEMSRITVPALVLAGENDLIRVEHTYALAALLTNSQLQILPGEDHSSYVINSDKLYPLITGFVDSLETPKQTV